MENNARRKKETLVIIGMAILLIGLVGITYAFFNYTRTGSLNNLGTGNISFNSNQGEALSITNMFPMTKNEALSSNLSSVEITITGDTTFNDGEEYIVSLVDVHNTVNGKVIPISYIATYENSDNKTIGTISDNYWNLRNNKDTNIYSLNSFGTIKENEEVLVGFIKNDNNGIDGTLSIKAYIDATRIAISDTYPEDLSVYKYNSANSSECIYYYTHEYDISPYLYTGETMEAFCDGTGTVRGYTFQDILDFGGFGAGELNYFMEHGIITKRNYLNQTSDQWVNGRTVLTTDEWNSIQESGNEISFKIRVESNEGIWVNEPASRNDIKNIDYYGVFTQEQKTSITEVNFIKMNEEMINEHENLIDLTAVGGQGVVKGWIENNKLYIASPGKTYLPVVSEDFFSDFTALRTINFNNIDASLVQYLNGFFYNCINLLSVDLHNFNSYNLLGIRGMFSQCTSLASINLKGFYTNNVTDMSGMFVGCSGLTSLDLSEFSTESVETMSNMFRGCSTLTTLDLSNFVTTNVTDMGSMFWMCYALQNINLSSFITTSVQNMSGMFAECTSLESIDLSSFVLSSAWITAGMFASDGALITIEVGAGWDATGVSVTSDMFMDCNSLVGGATTTYDPDHTDGLYARIDTGPLSQTPGYLTLKTS